MAPALKHARTSVLDIAYEETGPADGTPVFLMHGFPYDPRAFDGVVPLLAAKGCRTIVPYLRGYGPTRFLSASTPRSGQQAVLAHDLRALMDALVIERAIRTSSRWSSTPTGIASGSCPAIRRARRPKRAWPGGRPSRFRRSSCTGTITA